MQDYSHRVAVNAAALTVHANARADSQAHRADSIAAARRPAILRAVLDTTAANDAHLAADRAHAIGDLRAENVALRIENIALRRAVVSLWMATQQADTIMMLERARGDSLSKALADVNFSLQEVNARIQNVRPVPTWLRVSWHVVAFASVAYGGYQLGRHERCKC